MNLKKTGILGLDIFFRSVVCRVNFCQLSTISYVLCTFFFDEVSFLVGYFGIIYFQAILLILIFKRYLFLGLKELTTLSSTKFSRNCNITIYTTISTFTSVRPSGVRRRSSVTLQRFILLIAPDASTH